MRISINLETFMGRRKERGEETPGTHLVAKGKVVYLDGNDDLCWTLQGVLFCTKNGGSRGGLYSVTAEQSATVFRDGSTRQLRKGERVLVGTRDLVKQR